CVTAEHRQRDDAVPDRVGGDAIADGVHPPRDIVAGRVWQRRRASEEQIRPLRDIAERHTSRLHPHPYFICFRHGDGLANEREDFWRAVLWDDDTLIRRGVQRRFRRGRRNLRCRREPTRGRLTHGSPSYCETFIYE